MKKLNLSKETLRRLSNEEMDSAAGGTGSIVIKKSVLVACPPVTILTVTKASAVDACPSALACPMTDLTSVINPADKSAIVIGS